MWWVSHKIRTERENCCDDMAVSISGDRLSYAGALTSMEEIRAGQRKLAVAASGGNLFRRICRLLGNDSTDNTGLSWVPAATAILLIIALAIPTTLALTSKSDSTLTETKTEVPVEDDILIETVKDEESPVENIPPVPVLAKSPTPPKDKAHVRINCFVVEVYHDSKIDAEALAEAEELLGNKISPRERKIDVIMRAATEAMIASKDESDEKNRLTQDQYKAFIEMLASKGYIKILMNPTIETLNGKTATIRSAQHVPLQQKTKASPEIEYVDVVDLIEITPSVLEDGNIILDIEADLGSRNIPVSKEQTITVSSRQLSSKVCVSPGESVIIGGFVENHPAPRENINNNEKQAKELLLIITPTIITPPNNSPPPAHILIEIEKVQLAHKLKLLGLAVRMYADDNDNNLPESIQELRPYIRDRQDFDWIRDNVEYALKETKYQPNSRHIPVAYDKTLKEQQSGTNVLFLDGHIEFLTSQRLSELDIKRAEIRIEAWFLAVNKDFIENINHNADSPDEAKELLKLKSELLAAVDGSNKISFIHSDRDVSLLLKAVMAHKDSKVIATPQVTCLEGKRADIAVMNNETYYIVGYTEPNSPSEKPQPKLEKVEEGIELSLWPKLTPKKYIDMQFESVVTNFLDSEERKFEGKAPYKPPTVQRRAQSTRYVAKDGDTLLFGGHKIADSQDDRTEQKDLLILIKASTINSSEEDKPAKTENLIVAEPPTTTTNVITPPAIAKSRTERPKDNEQEKTKADETITEIFEIRYGDPVEIVEILKKLINGRPDTASVIKPDTASIIESSNGPILLIPEPKRKWIIAKASPENINQIGQWIKKLDTNKSTMGLDPMDKAVHEQLEMIVDLSELAPQMSFGEVIEILENSVEPPVQIQPIWKDLLENAEVEQATPAGMDPLPHVKLRKALEILLTSVSSTGLPKLTYIVDEGVILIGTVQMLSQKMANRVHDTSDLIETAADAAKASPENIKQIVQSLDKHATRNTIGIDPIDKAVYEQLEMIVDLSDLAPQMSFGEVVEKLENSVEPPLQIQPIWKDLLDNAEVEQTTPASMDPLPGIRLSKALEILLTSVTSSQPGEFGELTYVVNDGVILIGSEDLLPHKMLHCVYDISDLVSEPANYGQTGRMLGMRSMKMNGMDDGTMGGGMMGGGMDDSMMGGMGGMNVGGQDVYMQAQSLVQLIQETIEPDSWYKLSEKGEATIMAYPTQSPRKLAVMQTYMVHQQITRFLEDTRSSRREWEKTTPEIMIETVFLSVSDDFLKDVRLDANPEEFSDAWREHLAATYPAVKNGKPYGLILDDLQVTFLLRAVQAHHDSKALVAPRGRTRAGTTVDICTPEEYRYIKSYNEPNSPSNEPQPKRDKEIIGTHIWLTPKLADNNRNINLDLKLEMRQLKGIIEGKYKEKYPYYKPVIDVISAKMPCTIPVGKTMLIGGLKIIEDIKKVPAAPQLKDLPLIGAAFSSKDKPREQKMLLILIKPIINPQRKAAKILPGQEVSEE